MKKPSQTKAFSIYKGKLMHIGKNQRSNQTFKWAAALSLSVKTPVDSTTKSAPASPHGISSGFLNSRKRRWLQILLIKIFNNIWFICYLMPKTVTGFSPKRRVFSSLTLSSWCFHCPWTVSYLNMYVCKVPQLVNICSYIYIKWDIVIYTHIYRDPTMYQPKMSHGKSILNGTLAGQPP